MVAGGQEVRGNSASTAPQIDGFQEASRCQGPRHFPNLQPGEVNFDLLTRVFLDKSIDRKHNTRIMISRGMVSKGQYSNFGPGKGSQYSILKN